MKEALELLTQEEAARLVDMDRVVREALDRAQNAGIIFIDEIDTRSPAATRGTARTCPRGGVQRDLLPIVEGSNVNTKYGMVKTDHMLFIAAGAFHVAKVSDLIPELQEPRVRVELEPLGRGSRPYPEGAEELSRPPVHGAPPSEGVDVQFRDDAVEIARISADVNERMENIGARRLRTVMERLLDGVSFDAPGCGGSASSSTPRTSASGSRASPRTRTSPATSCSRSALEPPPRRCYKRKMAASEPVVERARKVLTPNYRQYPVVLVRGEGSRVWDAEGRRVPR